MTDEFEAHRDHLMAVAYRMLGSRTEAEDAVQDTYLRYASADRAAIHDLPAWLTTVTARVCLDELRSARVRRESYVGPWLPEPLVTRPPSGGDPAPEDAAVRADEVSMAVLVVLETLSPEQRVAFVLHDVFAVPFDEIAGVLSSTPAAVRQLATRARRAVAKGRPRHTATPAEQRRVIAAFLDAVQGGDIDRLVGVLAPDVVAVGDGGGVVSARRHPVEGDLQVARFLAGLLRQVIRPGAGPALVEPVEVNGHPGLLIEFGEPPTRGVMGFAVADGRITGIFNQLNPAKLGAVPAADPTRNVFGS